MKVVLFCGGLGLRLRDYAENLPKPMVTIGPRPVIWHPALTISAIRGDK